MLLINYRTQVIRQRQNTPKRQNSSWFVFVFGKKTSDKLTLRGLKGHPGAYLILPYFSYKGGEKWKLVWGGFEVNLVSLLTGKFFSESDASIFSYKHFFFIENHGFKESWKIGKTCGKSKVDFTFYRKFSQLSDVENFLQIKLLCDKLLRNNWIFHMQIGFHAKNPRRTP